MSERHDTAVSTLWKYNVRISGRYVVFLVRVVLNSCLVCSTAGPLTMVYVWNLI